MQHMYVERKKLQVGRKDIAMIILLMAVRDKSPFAQKSTEKKVQWSTTISRFGRTCMKQMRKGNQEGEKNEWIGHILQLFLGALDNGYKMGQVSTKYGIPITSLRDH